MDIRRVPSQCKRWHSVVDMHGSRHTMAWQQSHAMLSHAPLLGGLALSCVRRPGSRRLGRTRTGRSARTGQDVTLSPQRVGRQEWLSPERRQAARLWTASTDATETGTCLVRYRNAQGCHGPRQGRLRTCTLLARNRSAAATLRLLRLQAAASLGPCRLLLSVTRVSHAQHPIAVCRARALQACQLQTSTKVW